MNPDTAALVGTILAAAGLVFGVFRFFLAQIKGLTEEFTKKIADMRADVNEQLKSHISATERRFAEGAERRHNMSNDMQTGFSEIRREFVRRDDFNGRVTEILAAIKDLRDDVNKNYRNRNATQ